MAKRAKKKIWGGQVCVRVSLGKAIWPGAISWYLLFHLCTLLWSSRILWIMRMMPTIKTNSTKMYQVIFTEQVTAVKIKKKKKI